MYAKNAKTDRKKKKKNNIIDSVFFVFFVFFLRLIKQTKTKKKKQYLASITIFLHNVAFLNPFWERANIARQVHPPELCWQKSRTFLNTIATFVATAPEVDPLLLTVVEIQGHHDRRYLVPGFRDVVDVAGTQVRRQPPGTQGGYDAARGVNPKGYDRLRRCGRGTGGNRIRALLTFLFSGKNVLHDKTPVYIIVYFEYVYFLLLGYFFFFTLHHSHWLVF